MDWEQVLINLGVTAGFIAFIIFWVGLAMWLRVDADKHGMLGWAWAFAGIIGGPLSLFAYLVIRGNRPSLPVVVERDALIAETSRTGIASNFNPPIVPVVKDGQPELSKETLAALEAEERRFKIY